MKWGRIFQYSLLLLSACTGVQESQLWIGPLPTTTPITYTCTDVGRYNDITSCHLGTAAQCASDYQTFPNGQGAQCFSAVAGGENCLAQSASNPPNWIYTASTTWCSVAGTANSYKELQSLVGCSSSICLCPDSPPMTTIVRTCDYDGATVDTCSLIGSSGTRPTASDPNCP